MNAVVFPFWRQDDYAACVAIDGFEPGERIQRDS